MSLDLKLDVSGINWSELVEKNEWLEILSCWDGLLLEALKLWNPTWSYKSIIAMLIEWYAQQSEQLGSCHNGQICALQVTKRKEVYEAIK